ncbi:MAG: sulfite exporter TauE/SafE family protein [Euryarchaeota archaeon]
MIEPTALAAAEMVGTGLAAGFLGGLVGVGGGVLVLPLLVFLLGYPVPEAIATNVFSVVWTVTFGAMSHARIGNVDHETAAVVLAAGAIGALVGSAIFPLVMRHTGALRVALGAAFLFVSIRMIYEWLSRVPDSDAGCIPGSALSKTILGFGTGVLTGILGLGGGYVMVPSFVYLMGAPVRLAVGTSMIGMIPMVTVSASYKMAQGITDVVGGAILGLGTAVGARFGARATRVVEPWTLKGIFGVVFLAVSLRFILDGLGVSVLG